MDLLEQKNWFDSTDFQNKFHCETPLGVCCRRNGTVFHLWAPTAEAVSLNLYSEGIGGVPMEVVALQRTSKGLWIYETNQNLDGVYYEYDVTVGQTTRRTADPYAKACGLNGTRSMVVDLERTNPQGWKEDAPPAPGPEQIIYELHVKDFSWDPAGGFSEEDRGRYSALCRTGTTLNRDGLHPTGIDYLKRLGVTHIQLMPVYDYGSVDESCPDWQYNWGYDPVNYNVPEGSYSSDPYHGEVRIRELKEAIQALHRNGFRVIMDVVYNHTYFLESWLWRTVPWYYYRQNEDGSASNGSGCGNELASERSMCAKYILDSVLYWAEEYHMDGFRFDLMGLLDVDLMNRIQAALDERYGVGEKLIYGEPWGAAGSAARPGTQLCSKEHLKDLSPAIGAFCDKTRDAIKGSLFEERATGFVNGGYFSADYLLQCVTGWATGTHADVQAPSQTITYLSCHDDWTLWDKLIYTLSPGKKFYGRPPKVLRANRLAAAINFFCQGRPFLLAGEEFGRTKGGIKNTYHSEPWINQIDWNRAWENHRLVDYYRGLIGLRKKLVCLQDKTAQASERVVSAVNLAPGCAGISLRNNAAGTKWDKVLLIVNTDKQQRQQVDLPSGIWQVLADDKSSFRWKEYKTIIDVADMPPVSALILARVSKR